MFLPCQNLHFPAAKMEYSQAQPADKIGIQGINTLGDYERGSCTETDMALTGLK